MSRNENISLDRLHRGYSHSSGWRQIKCRTTIEVLDPSLPFGLFGLFGGLKSAMLVSMLLATCLLGVLGLVEGGRSGAPTSDPVRWLVISHLYAGMSVVYIKCALQLSRRTVFRIMERFRDTGSAASGRELYSDGLAAPCRLSARV